MNLSHDISNATYQVTSYQEGIITINETISLTASFIVGLEEIKENWQPRTTDELQASDFDLLIAYQPELIILGTGNQLTFPKPEVYANLLANNIGFECMDNGAACRTYNLLTSDGRQVAMGILLP